MRKILAAGVMLAGMLCSVAKADIIYVWEAKCVSRITFDASSGEGPVDLGCPNKKVRGLVKVWDGYIAGTEYYSHWAELSSDPMPLFTLYDSFLPFWHRDAVMDTYEDGFALVNLPAYRGAGSVWWGNNGMNLMSTGFYLENPYPGWSYIKWENQIFTRVPEPSSLALLGAGLVGVLGARRRNSHRSGTQSAD